jgi:hypothetical protein
LLPFEHRVIGDYSEFGYWRIALSQSKSARDLIRKLLHIEDTPERTALAYSIGIFLGFSPFLGFHTLMGLAVAFLCKLSRVAVLLGVWTNTPWTIAPYYTMTTWLGIKLTHYRIGSSTVREIFQAGMDRGFLSSDFWGRIVAQWGLLLSFLVGSLVFATLLAIAAYPLSLRWIKFYRSRKRS